MAGAAPVSPASHAADKAARRAMLQLGAMVFVVALGYGAGLPLVQLYLRQYVNDGPAIAWHVGMLGGVYTGALFLFAPFWGRLSDRYGRRSVLAAAFATFLAGGAAAALAPTLVTVYTSRFLAGAGAAAIVPTAQAYIDDISTPVERSRRFVLLGSASFVGFLAGPAFGTWVAGEIHAYRRRNRTRGSRAGGTHGFHSIDNSGGIGMRKFIIAILAGATLLLAGCGYNTFQTTDEQVKASWSEVLNQYQRRADLVPNIVNTVKGEAKFEQDTLTKVVEARSKATSIQATPELVNNPEAFQKFQQAQSQLTGALSRLMVVSENYPSLKANQGFRDLQAQLEGTENRITVARNRYIKSVQEYNVTVRSFPSNLTAMVFGYKEKANFAGENEKEISRPPSVGFDAVPAAPKGGASGAAK